MTDSSNAYLVGVCFPQADRREACDSFDELDRLAQSAGARISGRTFQDLKEIHSATLVGKGKAAQIKEDSQDADLIIFDADLSPVQQRNLENIIDKRVVDRTGLILDIFAQRAGTKEGQIQVELAQLQYMQTRLTGRGVDLSRLAGGIGTRGPGETKLEVDRRRIRLRISKLKKQLKQVRATRKLHRSRRKSVPLPIVALVGYTNSGKSTLINHLTDSDVVAEDRLFATLDPTTRRLTLPDGQRVLVTDTVGFIRSLPHSLVESFRATFEEITEADLILHIIDFSHPGWEEQSETAVQVLDEMGAGDKPVIRVYNKTDLVRLEGNRNPAAFNVSGSNDVYISALEGDGVEDLMWTMTRGLKQNMRRVKITLPVNAGGLLSEIYERGWVIGRNDEPGQVIIEANIEKTFASKLEKMGYVQ